MTKRRNLATINADTNPPTVKIHRRRIAARVLRDVIATAVVWALAQAVAVALGGELVSLSWYLLAAAVLVVAAAELIGSLRFVAQVYRYMVPELIRRRAKGGDQS